MWESDGIYWSCGPHTYFASEDECKKDPNYYTDQTSCSPVTIISSVMVSTGAFDPCYNGD